MKIKRDFLRKIEMFHKGDGNIKGNPAPMWHVLGSHHFFEKKAKLKVKIMVPIGKWGP